MLNRTIAPNIEEIHAINLVQPKKTKLSEHCHFYFLDEIPDETSKVELIFNAGTVHSTPEIVSLFNGLIFSGTADKSSTQIATELNDLGAYFDSTAGNDSSFISVYALKENMIPILKIIKDAIQNVAFHDHEIEEQKNHAIQKQRENLQKVDFLSRRIFQQKIYQGTPYEKLIEEEKLSNVSKADLFDYFKKQFLQSLYKIILAGNFNESETNEIKVLFKEWSIQSEPVFNQNFKNEPGIFHIEKGDALQTSIRIGKILFNKNHEDYIEFNVLNTILGDYFGSRLMSNIREDKGYTYGIGSAVVELKKTGYFTIVTSVGKEHTQATLEEIQKEINILKTELVDEKELDLVKNYLLGQILKSVDGPYAMLDIYTALDSIGIEMSYVNQSIEKIKAITPESLRIIAQKYLNWDEMTIVTAG